MMHFGECAKQGQACSCHVRRLLCRSCCCPGLLFLTVWALLGNNNMLDSGNLILKFQEGLLTGPTSLQASVCLLPHLESSKCPRRSASVFYASYLWVDVAQSCTRLQCYLDTVAGKGGGCTSQEITNLENPLYS